MVVITDPGSTQNYYSKYMLDKHSSPILDAIATSSKENDSEIEEQSPTAELDTSLKSRNINHTISIDNFSEASSPIINRSSSSSNFKRLEAEASSLPPDNMETIPLPRARFCKKCKLNSSLLFRNFLFQGNLPKPPRAHHCGICKKCTLRMDHHCRK
jgi:hypothetical protein